MPRTRSRPEGTEWPAFSGKFLTRPFRGRIVVSKWPRKGGPPKSELVREQNEWFAAVAKITKLADAGQVIAAMDAVKGTGVYPRDLLMHTISEGILDITEVDGTFVQHRRPRVEGVAFQGFRLQLTSNQGLPVSTNTIILWQNPVIDTAAFWDISIPTVITVPVGVTVMEMNITWLTDNEAGNFIDATIQLVGGGNFARAIYDTNFRFAGGIGTGPIPVTAGETYMVKYNPTQATNLLAGTPSSFTGKILGTT